MLQIIDPVRFEAFVTLMAQADPADLPHRGHTLRCDGDPDRRATRLPDILMAWLQRRHLDVDVEVPLAPARRSFRRPVHQRYAGPRLLRPADAHDQNPQVRTA